MIFVVVIVSIVVVTIACSVDSLLPQHAESLGCGWWGASRVGKVGANVFN
jgi:hypothetical protein